MFLGETIAPELIEKLCDRHWIDANARVVYKDKVNIVAELELEIKGKLREVVIKYFGWRNKISYWLSPFMRSRAQKSWDASQWLINHGINVPKPIAVFTRRKLGFIHENFLLTEKIADHITVRQFLKNTDSFERKAEVVKQLGLIVKKLHDGNFLHRDLTLGNFLLTDKGAQEIYLVDLNRLVWRPFLFKWQRLKDISKMNLCPCRLQLEHIDCLWLVFLNAYDNERFKSNLKILRAALNYRKKKLSLKTLCNSILKKS